MHCNMSAAVTLGSKSCPFQFYTVQEAYRVAQKMAPFLYALTLPNINRFKINSLSESGGNL